MRIIFAMEVRPGYETALHFKADYGKDQLRFAIDDPISGTARICCFANLKTISLLSVVSVIINANLILIRLKYLGTDSLDLHNIFYLCKGRTFTKFYHPVSKGISNIFESCQLLFRRGINIQFL